MKNKTTLFMNRSSSKIKLPPGAVAAPAELTEEEMFSSFFNESVVKRFLSFVKPYKYTVFFAFISVLTFTFTQLSIPILIQKTLDQEFNYWGEGINTLIFGVFFFSLAILINYISHYLMEFFISRVAQRLLFDLRRAMFKHLQRVNFSFMDKTEVGRLMSRLQGDVGALQEFLEASVHAFGDLK